MPEPRRLSDGRFRRQDLHGGAELSWSRLHKTRQYPTVLFLSTPVEFSRSDLISSHLGSRPVHVLHTSRVV